jgi:hypothetical protein
MLRQIQDRSFSWQNSATLLINPPASLGNEVRVKRAVANTVWESQTLVLPDALNGVRITTSEILPPSF